MAALFENSSLSSTPSGTVDIYKVYTEKYLPGKAALIARGEFTQTMYNFMVKGKVVTKQIRESTTSGMKTGRVCRAWDIVVDGSEGLTDLTLRRLYACLAFDNAFLGSGIGVQDFTRPLQEQEDSITKFIPSMSTSIDWTKLASHLTKQSLRDTVREKVQFAMTPGIQYVYRIWKEMVARSQGENSDMITAFYIGSLCSDMSRHDSHMKNHPTIKVDTVLSASVAMEERGTLSSFFINAAGSTGMNMELIKAGVQTAEIDAFIGSRMTCTSPSKGKQAVKDTLQKYMPADGNVPGKNELLEALGIRVG